MLTDFVFTVQYPDKVAFVTHLQRGGGDHHRVLFGRDQHSRVDELVREEGIVLVVKARLQLNGAGRGVDLVIQAEQGSFAELLFIGAVPGFHHQAFPGFLRLNDRRNVAFRQGKD